MMEISFEIFSNGIQCWYKDGAYHREGDHPAIIHPDGAKEYYVEGGLIKIFRTDLDIIHFDETLDRR